MADRAIDGLIDRVVFADHREQLVAATRALGRALLWHHYVVPQWTYGKVRTARWNRFAKPKTMPIYGDAAFPTIWWWDVVRKRLKLKLASKKIDGNRVYQITSAAVAPRQSRGRSTRQDRSCAA